MSTASLQLYGHRFSSYSWKALIPLYENETEFTFKEVSPDYPENNTVLKSRSPVGRFPLLLDGGCPIGIDSGVFKPKRM